jgi:hypothetical protein
MCTDKEECRRRLCIMCVCVCVCVYILLYYTTLFEVTGRNNN